MKLNNKFLIFFRGLSVVLFFSILIILESFGNNVNVYKDVFKYIDNRDWRNAEESAKKYKNPALTKVVQSQKFLDSKYKNNSFEEIVKFLQKNPHWPQFNKLSLIAENNLTNKTNKNSIVTWFNKHKPQTSEGYKFYALAGARLEKNQQKLEQIIKEGWIYGSFTREAEKKYLADFKHILQEKDHLKKIDEYFWNGKVEEAKRIFYLVNRLYRKNYDAQIAILNKDQDAEKLFNEVPTKAYTPSLIFNFLDSKKKEVPNSQEMYLFTLVKHDKEHADKWSKLQSYYSREFIDQKDWKNSYKVISNHFATDPTQIREAEWLAGWLALSFLHNPEAALPHFDRFIKMVKAPISLARGFYWLGRTYQALGNKEESIRFYRKASDYPYSFYGQLAALELNENTVVIRSQSPVASNLSYKHLSESIKNNNNLLQIIQAARILIKHGKLGLGLLYTKVAIDLAGNKSDIFHITNLIIADIIKHNNNVHYILEVAKYASQHQVFIKKYLYPTPYKNVDAALTYAIIRQESSFNQYAVSNKNAMGLMQLTGETAASISKSLGLKFDVNKLTKDANYNIKLGARESKDLLKKYNNSYIITLASYNAGPIVEKRWLDLFGDPKKLKNIREVIDWIELIPYSETRNYVQRVLENMQVYRSVMVNSDKLYPKKLEKDLVTYSGK